MKINKIELGKRIRKLREKKSQADFGLDFNVTNATVSRWESGGIEPSTETLLDIAKSYNVTSDWILTGREGGFSYFKIEHGNRKKVFNEEERRLISAFEKAAQRAKEDALFQLERHQSEV